MAATPGPTPAPTESLEIRVISAVNINPENVPDFEAYVKVEMRGQDGLVKARTGMGKWQPDGVVMKFDETMRLPIPIGAEEIRLKLCKDKRKGQSEGSSNVISNAGIYLRDLLRFVPIEKEFGLFRPADKTAGGTIKIFFDYKPSTAALPEAAPKKVERAVPQPKPQPETPTEKGAFVYATQPAQDIPSPQLPPASSVSQVKSHMAISSPAPPPPQEEEYSDDGSEDPKGGFPFKALILLSIAAVGAHFGIKSRR
mmetsp:Transcript_6108/g.8279  ORF Transcript_6108/g.8279 Transcript_6108/m.8279 type:complete len:255 (+) Transcript_6108:145-909(+)|eukprot:CAMPEP_0196574320 /NCGR_PEP_ID=MMETSP1081-20130531/4060_1 /TAXON_ID=36882 /ORGANISM="Pyramimonas amylifera, Strain CCMP720" /LENGTH=254 /DNA_ID=CAMNT_0041892311 /DNA_START=140 /DNA_END=904 /DNA_ORIENTATION=-